MLHLQYLQYNILYFSTDNIRHRTDRCTDKDTKIPVWLRKLLGDRRMFEPDCTVWITGIDVGKWRILGEQIRGGGDEDWAIFTVLSEGGNWRILVMVNGGDGE